MAVTPNLALPYLDAAQAQKHVTVNETLRRLDALLMLSILDRGLAAPPVSPVDGARYIVAASPTGAWAGHAGAIAAWQDGAWAFVVPRAGFLAYVADEAALLVWDGATWQPVGSGPLSELHNLTRLGVGTAADATNPVAAKLNNALWVARTAAEGGDGTLRYKMSKETAAATLSLLMQTNFSGRAEIGLAGDDDLHVKVSPDGATWFEAIRIDRASGRLSFPASGGPRQTLTANCIYYVRTDGNDGNSGLADTSGGAFATINAAITAAAALDCAIYDVTIQVRDGTYTTPVVLKPMLGAGTFSIQGNAAAPGNVVIATTAASAITADRWTVKDLKLTTATSGHCLDVKNFSTVKFSNLDFGTCSAYHIFAAAYGSITAVGNYAVSGGAVYHIAANAAVDVSSRMVTYSNSLNFSAANFLSGRGGVVTCYSMSFANGASVTGQRFSAQDGGVIFTGSAGTSYIPGSSPGAGTHFGASPYGLYA